MNGQSFSNFRDCHDLLAPVFEIMIGSEYFWIPLDTMKSFSLEPPKYLRDLFWAQGMLKLRDGKSLQIFVPVLYPRTFAAVEEKVKLGRETIWQEVGGGMVIGMGQRLFEVDEKEYSMLETKTLEFT